MSSSSRYVMVEEPPEDYRKVLEELQAAGFELDGVLDGVWDELSLFESSPTLVKLAVDMIVDELRKAPDRPRDYIRDGRFGWEVEVWRFVRGFLRDARAFYARRPHEA